MEDDTLILVAFDLDCPLNKEQQETLKTVAEYRQWDDSSFTLLGLRCELSDATPCTEIGDCPQLARLPKTIKPTELENHDYFLCHSPAKSQLAYPGHQKVLADCKEDFKAGKAGKGESKKHVGGA